MTASVLGKRSREIESDQFEPNKVAKEWVLPATDEQIKQFAKELFQQVRGQSIDKILESCVEAAMLSSVTAKEIKMEFRRIERETEEIENKKRLKVYDSILPIVADTAKATLTVASGFAGPIATALNLGLSAQAATATLNGLEKVAEGAGGAFDRKNNQKMGVHQFAENRATEAAREQKTRMDEDSQAYNNAFRAWEDAKSREETEKTNMMNRNS